MSLDMNILRAVFAARVGLAKETEEEAVEKARQEWRKTQAWVASTSNKEGSFNWYCQEFDLDEGAVRRAIREKRK